MNFKMDVGTIKMAIERFIETEAGLFKGHDGQVYAELGSFEGINIVSVDAARFQQWLTERCIAF